MATNIQASQEFDTFAAFKSALGMFGRAFFPLLLSAVIAGASYQLISDAGEFFGGFWKAFCLEAGALALIAWRPMNWLKLIRSVALLAAFGLVITAAGMNAARPHLDDSGLAPVDRIKLDALERSIEAHRDAVEAVKGQPRNSAMRAGDLAAAVEARDEFMAGVEPDAAIVAENHMAALTAILYRVALQLINWLLAHWLVSIIAARMEKSISDAPIQQPEQVKSLPQPEQTQSIPVDNDLRMDDKTLKILNKLSASQNHEARRITLQQARIGSADELNIRLEGLEAAGVIDVIPADRMTETVYRLRNGMA